LASFRNRITMHSFDVMTTGRHVTSDVAVSTNGEKW